MKVAFLFSGIALTFFLLSCKKEKTSSAPVIHIQFTRNALDYVNIQQGKYFIYKDSATALADSVVATTSLLEKIFVPEYRGNFIIFPAHNIERLTIRLDIKSANGGSFQWFYGTAETTANFPIASDTAYIYLSGGESNVMSEVFLRYHYQSSTETMAVEGVTYNNVVTDVNDSGLPVNSPNYRKTIYYWAKGVGIIKRTVITTGGVAKTYTLLRHN